MESHWLDVLRARETAGEIFVYAVAVIFEPPPAKTSVPPRSESVAALREAIWRDWKQHIRKLLYDQEKGHLEQWLEELKPEDLPEIFDLHFFRDVFGVPLGPLGLEIDLYRAKDCRFDAANIIGGIADALTGVAYRDDRYLAEVRYREARGAGKSLYHVAVYQYRMPLTGTIQSHL